MIYIGVDPGADGALATLYEDGCIAVVDCPSTFFKMARLVEGYKDMTVMVGIEKVNPFYKSAAKSAFAFGANFAAWQTAFACFHIPYELISPRIWQKATIGPTKGLDTKELSCGQAEILYPRAQLKTPRGRMLDGRCDALMIATYLKIKYEGAFMA